MKHSAIKSLVLATLLSATFSPIVYSADIARTLRVAPEDPTSPDNFFEIGLGVGGYIGSSLTEEDGQEFSAGVPITGSYNYKGFFIDVFAETSEPITLGYNAYNSKNWSFDVTLGVTGDGVSKSTNDRFEGIDERQSSVMLGGRLTGYFGENIVQFSIKQDVSGHSKGATASAIIGRNWQYRNWNFHGLMGLGFNDAKVTDYYFGVSELEAANTDFAQYKGKAQVNFFSTAGVTYPISENWIYRATVGLGTDFGSNDSTLFIKKRKVNVGFGTSISYVF
jgi:outer membrane scaffolding protein for murein synthesis (MipA/OmpV family)